MEVNQTDRGFNIIRFTDRYGVECSMQKSSLASEDAIWLGCNDTDPKVCINGEWKTAKMPEGDAVLFTNRMHLTRKQINDLLPFLIEFAATGEFTNNNKQPLVNNI